MLKEEWLKDWKDCVKKVKEKKDDGSCRASHVNLQGYVTAYESLLSALNAVDVDAFSQSPEYTPVIFMFAMLNYSEFPGFRLNKEMYSAYHFEKELLLIERAQVYVAAVE